MHIDGNGIVSRETLEHKHKTQPKKESKTMAKRWENLTIDGVDFMVDTKATATVPARAGIRTVDDCYERPSQWKRSIFESWQRWFINHDGWCSVASYNCMMFTLEGVLKVGDQLYRAYITKTRQELTPIA